VAALGLRGSFSFLDRIRDHLQLGENNVKLRRLHWGEWIGYNFGGYIRPGVAFCKVLPKGDTYLSKDRTALQGAT